MLPLGGEEQPSPSPRSERYVRMLRLAKLIQLNRGSKDWCPFKNDFRSTFWTAMIVRPSFVTAGAFDVKLIAKDLVGPLLNRSLLVADIA